MRMHPIIQLMRVDKPIGIWLLFFPAAWGVMLAPAPRAWYLVPIMLLGAAITRSAGCIINDLTDRRLDANVARTRSRPLASGALKPVYAMALLIALMLVALVIALSLPRTVFMIALCAVPMIAAYPWMKRITGWPQLFLGLTFNLAVLMGWAATGAPLSAAAYWLYAACCFWTLAYDTIYAIQDIADDRAVGIRSSTRTIVESRWLARRTAAPMRLAIGLSYLLMAGCFYRAAALTAGPGLAVPAAAMIVIWGSIQAYQAERAIAAPPGNAGDLFRRNQWLGVALLAAIGLL